MSLRQCANQCFFVSTLKCVNLIFHLTISSFTVSFLTGESPVPPPSTVSSSALSTSAVAPPSQPKPGSSSQQDRKVPPPIGTERLARIRQTGSVNPPLLTTSYTASVGQGGIWSFGVGSASGKSKFSFPYLFVENKINLSYCALVTDIIMQNLCVLVQKPCLVGPSP